MSFRCEIGIGNKSGNSILRVKLDSGMDVRKESVMTKREIETEILKELKAFMPTIKNMPFNKGLPLLQKEAWRLADKYDTDGANVINIMMSRFGELRDED